MQLVVGLGNPGPKYANTRHNIGVMVLDELLNRHSATLSAHKRTNTEIAEVSGAIFARTREFMNLSGGPVKALMNYFRPDGLIVLHDELDYDFGVVKERKTGDHGHNGLRSITKAVGPDYLRLALGIGRPPGRMEPAAFVLKQFTKAESVELPIMCADAADVVKKHF